MRQANHFSRSWVNDMFTQKPRFESSNYLLENAKQFEVGDAQKFYFNDYSSGAYTLNSTLS